LYFALTPTFVDRAQNGRLHLVPDVGKISLADALLVEDPSEQSGGGTGGTGDDDGKDQHNLKRWKSLPLTKEDH